MTPFKRYWIELSPEKKHELAEFCDTSYDYLSLIANGGRNAGPKLAKRIEKGTGRKVRRQHVMRPDLVEALS